MAYVTPSNRSTGDLITAAIWNQDVVENAKQDAVAKATAAGLVYANGANSLALLAASGNARKFLRFNAAGTAVEAAAVSSVIDAFQWGTSIGTRYVAFFGNVNMLNNAEYGDLVDAGWTQSGGSLTGVDPSSAKTGDLDAASDAGEAFAVFASSTNYIGSPNVVGGKAMLDAIEQETGSRPTTIKVWFQFQFAGTTDSADTTGVGIRSDANPALSGVGGYMITVGATNFELWDGSSATSLGVAKDGNLHTGAIEINVSGATYRVLLDGVEVKAAAAIAQDIWPMCFNAYKGASGDAVRVFAAGVNYD